MSSRRVISIHTFSPGSCSHQYPGMFRSSEGRAGQEHAPGGSRLRAEARDAQGGAGCAWWNYRPWSLRRLRDLGLCRPQAAPQGIGVGDQREPDRRGDKPAVCLGHPQVLGVSRINQRIDQNRTQLAQPGEQDCQRPVIVRVPGDPAARATAAAFQNESQVAAISFNGVFGDPGRRGSSTTYTSHRLPQSTGLRAERRSNV